MSKKLLELKDENDAYINMIKKKQIKRTTNNIAFYKKYCNRKRVKLAENKGISESESGKVEMIVSEHDGENYNVDLQIDTTYNKDYYKKRREFDRIKNMNIYESKKRVMDRSKQYIVNNNKFMRYGNTHILHAVNILDKIGLSINMLKQIQQKYCFAQDEGKTKIKLAKYEITEAIQLLQSCDVKPIVLSQLKRAERLTEKALQSYFFRMKYCNYAIMELNEARNDLILFF